MTGLFVKRVLGRPWGEVLQMSNDPRFLSAVVPSANVITTAGDVAVFYQCVMVGGSFDGTRVFEEETVQRSLEAPHDELVMTNARTYRFAAEPFHARLHRSTYGLDQPRAFGHVGGRICSRGPIQRELVVTMLTTAKPVIDHILPLVKLLAADRRGASRGPNDMSFGSAAGCRRAHDGWRVHEEAADAVRHDPHLSTVGR